MKKLWISLLAAILALIGNSPVLAAGQSAYIYFSKPQTGGQTCQAQVVIEKAAGLRGFEVHLTFDPTVVQVVDAQPNTPGTQVFLGGMFQDALVAENTVDNTKGDIYLSAAKPGAELTGTTDLISFELKGSRPGDAQLKFADRGLIIVDQRMQEIPISTTNGSLSVPAVGAAPAANPAANGEKPVLHATVTPLTNSKEDARNQTGALQQNQAGGAQAGSTQAGSSQGNTQSGNGQTGDIIAGGAQAGNAQASNAQAGNTDQVGKTLTIIGGAALAALVAYQLSRKHKSRRRKHKR